MRLKIKLKLKTGRLLTPNYHYQLGAAIYNLLDFGSPQFGKFLHDVGYLTDGKTFKLFTFALRFERFRFEGSVMHLISDEATLFVSSPGIDDFIRNIITGTFEHKKLVLDGFTKNEFAVVQMELLPEPVFGETAYFTLLSPLVASKPLTNGQLKKVYYLRETDTEELNRILSNNLSKKYRILNNQPDYSGSIELVFNENYLKRNGRITKKVTINERGEYPIEVIGLQAPFKISGASELIKTGYDAGFGEKNSMGFGMAEIDK